MEISKIAVALSIQYRWLAVAGHVFLWAFRGLRLVANGAAYYAASSHCLILLKLFNKLIYSESNLALYFNQTLEPVSTEMLSQLDSNAQTKTQNLAKTFKLLSLSLLKPK